MMHRSAWGLLLFLHTIRRLTRCYNNVDTSTRSFGGFQPAGFSSLTLLIGSSAIIVKNTVAYKVAVHMTVAYKTVHKLISSTRSFGGFQPTGLSFNPLDQAFQPQ